MAVPLPLRLSLLVSTASAVNLHRADPKPCECLTWKEVYKTGKANCGEGFELFEKEDTLSTGFFKENPLFVNETSGRHEDLAFGPLCHDAPGTHFTAWFPRQAHNLCVKEQKRWHEPHVSKNWCYVSAACPTSDLNGGRAVNGAVSSKYCPVGGPDKALGDFDIVALEQMTRLLKSDIQLTFTMAFPWQSAVSADTPSFAGARLLNFTNGLHYVMQKNATDNMPNYWEVKEDMIEQLTEYPPKPVIKVIKAAPTPNPIVAGIFDFLGKELEQSLKDNFGKLPQKPVTKEAPTPNPVAAAIFDAVAR